MFIIVALTTLILFRRELNTVSCFLFLFLTSFITMDIMECSIKEIFNCHTGYANHLSHVVGVNDRQINNCLFFTINSIIQLYIYWKQLSTLYARSFLKLKMVEYKREEYGNVRLMKIFFLDCVFCRNCCKWNDKFGFKTWY